MPWLRWDAAYLNHPDVILLPFEGKVIFWQACMVCKLHDRRGVLPGKFTSPAFLALGLGCEVSFARRGCVAVEASDLVKVGVDGSWEINGWKKLQPDPTAADRKARQRESNDSDTLAPDVTGTRVRHGCHGDVTGRDGTIHTENNTPLKPPQGGARADQPVLTLGEEEQAPKKRTRKPKTQTTTVHLEDRQEIYLAWQTATGRLTGADAWETGGVNDKHICDRLATFTKADLLRAIAAQCADVFWRDKTFGGLMKPSNIVAGLAKANQGSAPQRPPAGRYDRPRPMTKEEFEAACPPDERVL